MDVTDIPTALGITNPITATDSDQLANSLVFDPSVTNVPSNHPASFVITSILSSASPSPTSKLSSTTTSPMTSHSNSSNASAPMSVTAVVLTCICAFIAAVSLICIAWGFYRRYHNGLIAEAKSSGGAPSQGNYNKQREVERRRSRLEPWNRLRESDDKWEAAYHSKDSEAVPPMEKFAMFKRSPSVRTAWTQKTDHDFDPQSFASYLPSLPECKETPPTVAAPQDDGALLVLPQHSSPTLGIAIPTPPAAVSSLLHQPESARVMEYHRPDNPFDPPPSVPRHTADVSNDSTTSQERALRSLIAALDYSGVGDEPEVEGSQRGNAKKLSSISSVYSSTAEHGIDPYYNASGRR